MAKKQIWRDNNTPPTNYIWVKTNSMNTVEGVYEHNGVRWIKIASGGVPSGDGVPVVTAPKKIYATDFQGNQIVIDYSDQPTANTIAIRTDNGTLKAADPIDKDDLVTAKMLMWNE